MILPAKVQGEGAAAEMVTMLRVAEELGIFDLLVIGRGGGSLEDLWAFNEEPLVRAVAACGVPIISAVGHEIDVTLCDFAADLRAETPSAAAELISSRFVACAERVARAADLLQRGVAARAEAARGRLEHAAAQLRLLTPAALVERGYLRIDDQRNRLEAALYRSVRERRHALARVAAERERVSPEMRIRLESQRLLGLWKRLEAASPVSVLNRGFVILRDDAGRPVIRRQSLSSGARVSAEFADGRASLTVE